KELFLSFSTVLLWSYAAIFTTNKYVCSKLKKTIIKNAFVRCHRVNRLTSLHYLTNALAWWHFGYPDISGTVRLSTLILFFMDVLLTVLYRFGPKLDQSKGD